MIRQASIDTFHDIENSGLLSKRRLQVYEMLFFNGPMVGSEVARRVKAKYGSWSESETIRNRLTELRNSGVVYEVGKAKDPKNGRIVILWDVTAHLPKKIQRKKRIKCEHCKGRDTSMKFKKKDDIQSVFNGRASCQKEADQFNELVRLAENGWQIEENIRKDHVRHCIGNEFCNWRAAHEELVTV